MTRNMGTVDRTLRILIAAGVAVLYFLDAISGTVALVMGILAITLVFTSAMSFCPLYLPFKIRTTRKP